MDIISIASLVLRGLTSLQAPASRVSNSPTKIIYWAFVGVTLSSAYIFVLLGAYKLFIIEYGDVWACFLLSGVLMGSAGIGMIFYSYVKKTQQEKLSKSQAALMDNALKELEPIVKTTHTLLKALREESVGRLKDKPIQTALWLVAIGFIAGKVLNILPSKK
jgi:hypothetical protein